MTIESILPEDILCEGSVYYKEDKKLVLHLSKEPENKEELEVKIKEVLPFLEKVEFLYYNQEAAERRIEERKQSLLQKLNEESKNYPETIGEVSNGNHQNGFPFARKSRKIFQSVKESCEDIQDIFRYKDTNAVTRIKAVLHSLEERETKIGNIELSLNFYDKTASITGKVYVDRKKREETLQQLKQGYIYRAEGVVVTNTFLQDLQFNVQKLEEVGKPQERMDTSERKHVELHLHTKKSALEGLLDVSTVIKKAEEWGMPAVGITDRDSVHGFIEAYDLTRKSPVKVIYGLESVIYDEDGAIFDKRLTLPLDDVYVALDIETTGLNIEKDAIIEIGAVKINRGSIVDTFSSFLQYDGDLDPRITEITGITHGHLQDAPKPEQVMKDFVSFIGDAPLVAHNAPFDIPIIKNALKRLCDVTIDNPSVDTIVLSQLLLPKIKRYSLNRVASHLKISMGQHHRALDDALTCAKIFLHFLELLHNKNIPSISHLENKVDKKDYHLRHTRKSTVCFLVKTQEGLRNLYQMFSTANLKFLHRGGPSFPYSLVEKHREGILVGACGEDHEIFKTLLNGGDPTPLFSMYDYVEILPFGNYMSFYQKGEIKDRTHYESLINELVKISPIPVVASSNVRYLDQEDFFYRNMILYGQKRNLTLEKEGAYYWRTTDELLEEFSFLGDDCEKVVIDNPEMIVEMVQDILPFPKEKYPPTLENSQEILQDLCYEKAYELYGSPLPEIVEKRLEFELRMIIDNGFAVLYIAAHKLVDKSLEKGFLVGSRGSVGSSLAATLSGITEVNPLQAHYRCPGCQYSEFHGTELDNGYDLPQKNCPHCNIPLIRDGYNIPFESFMGFKGNKEPDIDLNFSPRIQSYIHHYTGELFGHGHVFKAGTFSAIQENTAIGYMRHFYESHELPFSNTDVPRILDKIVGVGRSTGQHPGGIIVIPENMEIYDFTPIQYPANKEESGVITTHFDYDAMKGKLLKLDILGHEDPSIIRHLQDITGIDPLSIPIDDPKVLSIFSNISSIGIDHEAYTETVASLGIPEFGTPFVRKMLEEIQPKSVADIIRVSGLSHGKNIWVDNMQKMMDEGKIDFTQVTSTREQIMLSCMEKGMERDISFKIMENVRKGKGLSQAEIQAMEKYHVEPWFIEAWNKISYMFPKAHAVAYVLMALRIAWYKVYHPKAFYAAHLSTKVQYVNAKSVASLREVENELNELLGKPEKSAKDNGEIGVLEIVRELYYRDIQLLPVDLYISKACEFTVEEEGVRLPLQSVEALGEKAALAIVEARKEGEFLSVEDLKDRAKVNSRALEGLEGVGCLDGLSESNQLSLFDMY